MRLRLIILGMLLASSINAQVPAKGVPIEGSVLIRYATVHVGNGEVIKNAYVVVTGNEISQVSDANSVRIDPSAHDTIIEADGKHIYPGFMIMDSRLGLVEIGAVGATHDFDETGEFLPNTRSLPAFNTESKIISTVRTNGVLLGQIAPSGGRISGSSSVVHFDGWDWQDATVRADEGVFLNWPSRYAHTGWWAEPGGSKVNKKYTDQTQEIHDYFSEAAAYQRQVSHKEKNLRFEAMAGIFEGSSRLYVRVNWARDILDVVQFIRAHDIKLVCVVGGAEAHLVTTELRENKIAVIIDRVHQLPSHEDSPLDEPFEQAAKLVADGVEIAFATAGGMEAMISRNLPFQVGTAVAYGLEYEKAIEALTLTPANLTGIADRFGSVEPGKNATFFISEGDALDMRSNKLSVAFIDGRYIDLSNHQLELYEKFAKKHNVKID